MGLGGYTLVFLVRRATGHGLTGRELDDVQEAHRRHVDALARDGHLVAGGAVLDDVLVELSVLDVDREQVCELIESDPALQAGLYTAWVVPWIVSRGLEFFDWAGVLAVWKGSNSGYPAGRAERPLASLAL